MTPGKELGVRAAADEGGGEAGGGIEPGHRRDDRVEEGEGGIGGDAELLMDDRHLGVADRLLDLPPEVLGVPAGEDAAGDVEIVAGWGWGGTWTEARSFLRENDARAARG